MSMNPTEKAYTPDSYQPVIRLANLSENEPILFSDALTHQLFALYQSRFSNPEVQEAYKNYRSHLSHSKSNSVKQVKESVL